MPAYYNEFDPYAAQWLRNLIKAGHIAPGEVDERSIRDVSPDDLRGFTQCHFFAGIGIWSYAARRAGRTIANYGRGLARVSLSVLRVNEKESKMTGTSGPNTSGLSPSAALTLSLASRLQARTASLGSRVYKLTWKERAMPSGRSIPALRASQMKPGTKVSTSDSDSIGEPNGWNTPRATDGSNGGPNQAGGALSHDASLCGWATPTTRDHKDGSSDGTAPTNGLLGRQARLAKPAGWATPKASDGSGGRTTETLGGGNVHLDKQARMAGWASPRAQISGDTAESHEARQARVTQKHGRRMGTPIEVQVTWVVAGWPTPLSAPDSPASHNQVSGQFRRAMLAAMPVSTGSPAETASGGRLRAGHSRWLMRIPHAWDDCAPTETRSTRRKPKASSKRGSTVIPVDVSDIC